MSTANQFVTQIRKKLTSKNTSAFELGEYLCKLDDQLRTERAGFRVSELLKKPKVRGRSRAKNHQFMRLYRIYQDYPPDVMRGLSDQKAFVLSRDIYQGGHVMNDNELDPKKFRMQPDKALEIALTECSAETLGVAIRWGANDSGCFANERKIEDWFARNNDFLHAHDIEVIERQVAVGPAMRDIDFITRKSQDPDTIVILELKDTAYYEDIGQVLGQRNELLEHSKDGKAFMYKKHKGSAYKFSNPNKEVEFRTVEVWLIAQAFDAGTYYAAKGQDISLFKITNERQIVGPLHTAKMTQSDWLNFTTNQFV